MCTSSACVQSSTSWARIALSRQCAVSHTRFRPNWLFLRKLLGTHDDSHHSGGRDNLIVCCEVRVVSIGALWWRVASASSRTRNPGRGRIASRAGNIPQRDAQALV